MKQLESTIYRTSILKAMSNRGIFKPLLKNVRLNYELYLFILPAVIVIFVFNYIPMYGIQIAFKDFDPIKGISGSPWVGFKHLIRFFHSYQFWSLLRNTLGLSTYLIIAGFPAPIVLAIIVNQIKNRRFRNVVQTVTFMPHFVSVVVVVGMILLFLSPKSGLVAHIFRALGMSPVYFMGEAKWFKSVYVLSELWMHTGWDSIIYLAALSTIDSNLYDATKMDGASRWQIIRYLEFPFLKNLIVILLILRLGNIMSLWFEKVYLLQNDLNTQSSEIIVTYVYKIGLLSSQYSYAAAIGFFNVIINFVLLLVANEVSRKLSEVSLF